MVDLLDKYGFSLQNGFMCCPFHIEKTPSFKVYAENKRFKCFGCGEGGSVIDFVMKYFDIGFRQALEKISDDFSLNLFRSSSKYEQMMMAKRQKEKQLQREEISRAAKIIDDVYFDSLAKLDFYEELKKRYKGNEPLYIIACEKITELNVLLDYIEIKRSEMFVRSNT